ncbi:single-stranded-DNA-specific exonuclease RecJ [Anoxybacter fermentans]|uniref:Single-stranded-DNA-specific exonuclease RecJ n=1 Tax=Anoxybacter fermentans TaxID=1323375 RepID=A0A3Q9HQI2_9FIRM|nr:single-stranded-DNA-specific exonuclease RecJ [Anoxybacter fermentans]AZR73328.1 single-stranded-DNA-specific exonuclease RecJ [Anoxybacter fermentans]
MEVKVLYHDNLEVPKWMLDELNGNQLLAQILLKRGINSPKKVREFLNPDQYNPTNPFDFPDMDKAVELILNAVKKKKKICVYGDYDVDGVTATAILVTLLKKLDANVSYHIPNRFTEGYGMNERIIKNMAGDVDLILTCDCGISNHNEVALAKKLGMTVIVTDHHHLPEELPAADVILSPKLLPEDHKAHNISGASMAYFLAKGVLTRLNKTAYAREFLDLVALSTIADVVPLKGENRYLLQRGIPALAKTNRPGLLELFNICGLNSSEISEEEIAYQIVPRINAAGRISSARIGVELLLATTRNKARTLARELDQINDRRKELCDKMLEEALALLGKDFHSQPIILYQPHWHQGIIGITAGRLCEKYHVPVLLMCLKEDGKTITGSARSIPGIHIYEALKTCEQFLDKFGGHAGAAGFSLTRDKLTGFEKAMEKVLARELEKSGGIREIEVDGRLPLSKISTKTYYDLRKLAPFGEENPVPIFLCNDAEVVYHRPTSDEKHLRLIVKHENTQYSAIWWWGGEAGVARKIDLVYSIGINRWQGREEIQLIVNHTINRKQITKAGLPEKPEKLTFEIEDWRNWYRLGKVLPDFKNAVYYYEGTEKLKFENLINRYQSVKADYLVLLSSPPGIRVLKELIYLIRPKIVVLAYSDFEIQSGNSFLTRLSGIIKHVIKNKNGKVNIYQISALTGEMENTVLVGLKYLEDRGFIELEFSNPDNLFIKKGKGQNKKGSTIKENKLKALLKESRAFRNYMLKSTPEKIKNLILNEC